MTEPWRRAGAHSEQEWQDWDSYFKARAAAGWCPYSGLTIVSCKRSDLCDCFDFPERDEKPS